jgi:hypothetical protein
MQLARPGIALDPRHFGRGRHAYVPADAKDPTGGDLKLFATTFLGGFVFVSMLLA